MTRSCVACGAALADGAEFCGSCGTANRVDGSAIALIDAAPTDRVAHAEGTGRPVVSAAAPITVGRPTGLAGPSEAAKPEPGPWEDETVKAKERRAGASPANPRRMKVAVVCAVVAAIALVPAVFAWRLTMTVGWTSSAAASRLAFLHTHGDVATALGHTVADELVGRGFVEPSQRGEAARKATDAIESPSFTPAWKRMVGDAQSATVTGSGTGGPSAVSLDLTPVVSRLRYDGIAASNAQIPPLALGPVKSSTRAGGYEATVAIIAFAGPLLVLLTGIVALLLSRGFRRRTLRTFGIAIAAWSVILTVFAVVLAGTAIGPAPSPAARTVVAAAKHVVIGDLVRVGIAIVAVGVVIVGLTMLGGRRVSGTSKA